MKRYTLRLLQRHDQQHDDCAVRELEMVADAHLSPVDYIPQFWRDVSLYGVDEAILYVRNGNYGNAQALEQAWQSIRQRIDSQAMLVASRN